MAVRGVNLSEKEEFILSSDPGNPEHPEFKIADKAGKETEKPTIFYIGNMSENQRIEIGDMTATPTMIGGGITMTMRNTKRNYEIVKAGLKGWDNMQDANGKPLKFDQTTAAAADGTFLPVVSPTCMSALTSDMITEIAAAILRKNGMSAELEKKSDGASQLQDDLSSALGDAPTAPKPSKRKEDA